MKRIYEYKDIELVLDKLLENKESADLEFKSAKGGFPHSKHIHRLPTLMEVQLYLESKKKMSNSF